MSDTETHPIASGNPAGDQEAFKRAFRRLAAGVAAVTALDPAGGPRGFTATSLASLAATPPLARATRHGVSSHERGGRSRRPGRRVLEAPIWR